MFAQFTLNDFLVFVLCARTTQWKSSLHAFPCIVKWLVCGRHSQCNIDLRCLSTVLFYFCLGRDGFGSEYSQHRRLNFFAYNTQAAHLFLHFGVLNQIRVNVKKIITINVGFSKEKRIVFKISDARSLDIRISGARFCHLREFMWCFIDKWASIAGKCPSKSIEIDFTACTKPHVGSHKSRV